MNRIAEPHVSPPLTITMSAQLGPRVARLRRRLHRQAFGLPSLLDQRSERVARPLEAGALLHHVHEAGCFQDLRRVSRSTADRAADRELRLLAERGVHHAQELGRARDRNVVGAGWMATIELGAA